MTKKFIICFIIAFFTLLNGKRVFSQENGNTGDSICEIASRKMTIHNYGGELSDYWAQEYIGSDLFREEFSDWLEENPPPTNLVTVIDAPSNESHGVLVTNLIAHQKKQAILPHVKIRNFWVNWLSGPDVLDDGTGVYIVSNFLASRPSFSFVNNSMYWQPSEYLSYKKISDRGSIIVSASGNLFPQRVSSVKRRAGKNLNIIIVGSLRPSGLISIFSQEDESVTILAPSNHEILSIGTNGEERLFGGTSGATPLVTGSLAAFEWITNYHPKINELKLLLKKTAIPSLMSHQKPNENGYGMLNAYKITRVAEKISLSCQNKGPQERRTCIQESMKRDETYQFPEFSRNDLRDSLNAHFPGCVLELELGKPTGSHNVVCENKKEAIKKIRKEALLDPYNKNLWEALSCIYKKEGFLFNSIYYDTTALAAGYPINRDKVLSTVKEILSAREENFSKVLKDENLKKEEFVQIVERNLSHELMVMFRIRSSFFPDTLFSLLKEKLQFFESYEYVNSSFKEEHLSLVMHLSGLLNQKEDRAFFQTKGFSRYASTHPEAPQQNTSEKPLEICDLIDSYAKRKRQGRKDRQQSIQFGPVEPEPEQIGPVREKRGEGGVLLNLGYNYPGQVRASLIESSVFLENEDEKWSLLKKGLEDENLYLRSVAIQHFYTLESDERKLQILNCLKNWDHNLENLHTGIITLLTSLKDEQNRENFFREILSDGTQSPDLKSSIIKVLWSLNEATRVELLKAYFSYEDPILRRAVISSLWMLNDGSEIEKLLNVALNDKDFGVKSLALLSIGSLIHDKNKIPFIDFALKNMDPNIKALSMKMIWFLENPSMVEEYFHLGFRHSAFEVRNEAIRQVPYLNKSMQQKADLFKLGMEDSNSFVQLEAVKSSLQFSKQIEGENQLVIDLYQTILSTVSSLLHQMLNHEENLNFIVEFIIEDQNVIFSGLLDKTLKNILEFFILSQNEDLELSFLDFFKKELNNTQANISVIYIFKVLSVVNLYFPEDEIIQIGLLKLLEEMIKDEENSIDTVTQIVEYSIELFIKEIIFNEDLENSILISLEQGLNHLEIVTRIEIMKKVLSSEIFKINAYGVSHRKLNKVRNLFLDLINRGLDELESEPSNDP